MAALDSDIIIDFVRGKQDAVNKFRSLLNEELITTQINFFEVMQGIYSKENLSKLELTKCLDFFGKLTVLDIDSYSALQAAKLSGWLNLKGLGLESGDCLIAGTLITNNCKKIITRNQKHFSRFKEITTISY